MKVIVSVFVILAVALAGFVGFVAVDSKSAAPSKGPGIVDRKVETISHGAPVSFADHVSSGVVTVFNFTGDW